MVSRHKKAVAKIIPLTRKDGSRIGTLAGRKFKMGAGFDNTAKNSVLTADFGISRR